MALAECTKTIDRQRSQGTQLCISGIAQSMVAWLLQVGPELFLAAAATLRVAYLVASPRADSDLALAFFF